MTEIVTFPFDKEKFDQIRQYRFGKNWPVVYVIEDKREAYIGQTVNVNFRSKQHYENPERRKLKNIHIISDEEFNLSANYDIEAWLIQYMAADGKYILQNGNGGLQNHNYYDRAKYRAKFESLWETLKSNDLVQHSLDFIKNTDLFKYSPYKSLTDDQLFVARSIVHEIAKELPQSFTVNGKPGTGKTILATYLCKFLLEHEKTKHLKIGLVVPMASLRGTLKGVFAKVKGLKSNMVIGPNDVARTTFDLLIIDESHRLQRRRNIMGYGSYDNVNKVLNLSKESTQLDWMMKQSKYQIFLYDKNQTVKPADVRHGDFEKINAKQYTISTQMRIGAGEEFVDFIDDIFSLIQPKKIVFQNYDFKLYDNIHELVQHIKDKDRTHKLCRLVAGYAWLWHTKPGSKSEKGYDIDIDGIELIWNSTTRDWVNSKNAINEVGCIHTVQGYDLNYVGVIIGPELSYDPVYHTLNVNREKYFDINGRNGITDPEELERYIINIYKTLLTRGVLGTYIYIVDDALRAYIQGLLNKTPIDHADSDLIQTIEINTTPSPYQEDIIEIPLYDSIGCGEAMYADPIAHETYSVPKSLIHTGAKYFVLRTSGDSMSALGITEGDYILCRKNYQAPSGSIAVVLLGDDATLKEIHYEKDGLLLKPRSNNPSHQSRKLIEGDDFKILGELIKKLI